MSRNVTLNEIWEIPVKYVVSYLGIKMCKNQEERARLNFISLMEKVGKKFDSWLGRDLLLYGRVLLSKSKGLSRFIYGALALDVPQPLVKQTDSNLLNFIWRNKPNYLKKV